MEKLKVFKMKLSVPLPDNHEELHSEQIRCKVREVGYTGTYQLFCTICPAETFSASHPHYYPDNVSHTSVTFSLPTRINKHTGGFFSTKPISFF